MLQNYLKIALRNLRTNLRHILINVFGLGFALAFCLLAFMVWQFSRSFDSWHADTQRIVRVETVKLANGETNGICPAPVAAAAQNLAAVEAATTFDSWGAVVKRGDQVFNEQVFFTDENFRKIFQFDLLAGSDDLADRSRVLITEELALKFFGKENPIGQELTFFADAEFKFPLTVGGVLKNCPLNSSLRFGFLTHRDNQLEAGKPRDFNSWKASMDAVFVKLKNVDALPTLAEELKKLLPAQNLAQPDWKLASFRFTPLRRVALQSEELRINGLWNGVPPAAVWGNIVLAIMLLLAAVLNFANMTLAICNRRLREMGVRKVMGSTRGQVIRQVLIESLVVVAVGLILGVAFAFPVVDWFNATWRFTDFEVNLRDPLVLSFLAAVLLGTTFLAGIYPAFFVSRFNPAHIFRGGVLAAGGSNLSRGMMAFQVVISIFAAITAISFAKNAEFNRSADIGYSYQNVLQAWTPNESAYRTFEAAARSVPGVEATCGSRHLMGFGYTMSDIDWHGEPHSTITYEVGNGFLKMMNFRLLDGKLPAPAGDTTMASEIVVNQKFAAEICGGRSPIGERIRLKDKDLTIVGVVADFMTNRPFVAIAPVVVWQTPPTRFQRCAIQTASPDAAKRVLAALEIEWKRVFPNTPFNVGYQNEVLQEAFEVSNNIAQTMRVFALVTIVLCITGLFSILSLDIQRRTRELAVRRVLGASAGHIGWILNRKLLIFFGLAIVVGCFLGKFFSQLLMDSIFKINAGVSASALIFGAAGVILVLGLTVFLKIFQVLRVNPSEVLRGE